MARQQLRAHVARGRSLLSLAVLGALLAILTLAPMLFVSPALAAPARPSGSTNPTIVWDGSMIYTGQNSGNPWGPVGEHSRVQGQNFPDGQYKLVLAKGDVNDPTTGAAVCLPSNLIDLGVAVAVSGGSGTFDAMFDWPAAANQVHAGYSICALKASDGTLASHSDSGPFTVLSANPPQIQLSTTTLARGASLTVTGQNFVPPQSILVYAAPCQACGAPKTAQATVTSADLNAGTFTVTLDIPAGATPGHYYVGAISQNGVLSAPEQTITVTPPSPTATSTTAPTATATSTATPTQAASGSSGTGRSNDHNGPLVAALIAAFVVLLAILAGLIAYLAARRRTSPSGGYPTTPYRPDGGAAYGATPPLPMPDEQPTQPGSFDPAATRAVSQQPGAALSPADPDAPTDPGLRSARDANR